MTSDDVAKMIAATVNLEGGYSNNPNDPGGETNHGITIKVAHANGYFGAMRDLPLATALTIYRTEFWDLPGFASIAALSEGIGRKLFDAGVNNGVGTASGWLQRALNVLDQKAASEGLKVDGHAGAGTQAALAAFLRLRGKLGETVMLRALNGLQTSHYIELAEARPQFEEDTFGWLANRIS